MAIYLVLKNIINIFINRLFLYTQSLTNHAQTKEVSVNRTLYPVAGHTGADCVEDQRPGSAVSHSQVVTNVCFVFKIHFEDFLMRYM